MILSLFLFFSSRERGVCVIVYCLFFCIVLFWVLGFDLMMFVCKRLCRKGLAGFSASDPDTFSLPSPLPVWPQGQGFASGRINLGELEVFEIAEFEPVWRHNPSQNKNKGLTFYKPVRIPDGFHCLGHYCQPNNQPLRGFVLVARELDTPVPGISHPKPPALREPLDYHLVWSPDDGAEQKHGGCGCVWLPRAPEGYKPVGFLVTNKPDKPSLDEVRCVRADLTDKCEAYRLLLDCNSRCKNLPFRVWCTRPRHRGMMGKGVPVGTFFCSSNWNSGEDLCIGCLKNLNPALNGMPNVDQIHALINHYGPTVFFHPEEVYLPSSVSWFFENGALLCRPGVTHGEAIDARGTNLPCGGANDGEFWIDLPSDKRRDIIKRGNIESAKLYVHVKPALGGTFTDIVMWVFCPFNGPATLKVGRLMNVALSKIGEHVSDWEHFTLRICNFTGGLWSIYFAQHSGGKWVDAYDLEYIEGNKAIVYSSRNGHASYPHPGTYIQGSSNLGVGIRNDAARSDLFVDSSKRYELVAAQYLGDGVVTEPCWLQFMRKWGPRIVYDSRTELDKIINRLPLMVRRSVANWFRKFPVELYGEEGPTGPKEKNYWVGDERG